MELDKLLRRVTGIAKARHVAAYVRILLESGAPVLLAGWHRDVYDIWRGALAEFRPVLYSGTETAKQKDRAKQVGAAVAKKCLEKGIDKVVFDRAGYKYHGRISAIADGAREGGLQF